MPDAPVTRAGAYRGIRTDIASYELTVALPASPV